MVKFTTISVVVSNVRDDTVSILPPNSFTVYPLANVLLKLECSTTIDFKPVVLITGTLH